MPSTTLRRRILPLETLESNVQDDNLMWHTQRFPIRFSLEFSAPVSYQHHTRKETETAIIFLEQEKKDFLFVGTFLAQNFLSIVQAVSDTKKTSRSYLFPGGGKCSCTLL